MQVFSFLSMNLQRQSVEMEGSVFPEVHGVRKHD